MTLLDRLTDFLLILLRQLLKAIDDRGVSVALVVDELLHVTDDLGRHATPAED